MAKRLNSFRRNQTAEEREKNFVLSSANAPIPRYDALRDANLRQYFESKTVQSFLQSTGWVDKAGKIIDLDKFRAKLNIIEQEFKYAEKTEFWRMKEEEEMRRTIQIKRERALQDAKRQERAMKIKEENRIRRGIILAVRGQAGSSYSGTPKHTLDVSGALQREPSIEAQPSGRQDARSGGRPQQDGEVYANGGTGEGGDLGGDAFFVTQQPSM